MDKQIFQRVRRSLGVCAAVLALTACSAATTPWYEGSWQVSDTRFPAVSAMSAEQAEDWLGQSVLYTPGYAEYAGERCEQPSYSEAELDQSEFYTIYRARFEQLDIAGPMVTLLHVSCDNDWQTPATTFIKVNETRGYMTWDGAFFELIKRPAPRA